MSKFRRGKKSTSAMALAKKNKREISKLKAAPEMKHRYLLQAFAVQPAGFDEFLFNNMATGTDDQERIGNSVSAKQLYISCLLVNSTAGGTSTNVRMIVIEHKCAQGVIINPQEILEHTATNTNLVFSPYDMSFIGDYRIFSDDVITLSGLENEHHKKSYRRNIKLNRNVKYNGNGATIASIEGAAYYLLIVTEGANSVSAEVHGTFSYTDT